mmetsp:Transcript_1464/g.2405  ORF Transcript_1464/g.2405 Transcript_1464/m.2405 type:complete len:311 (+) Transcript_1464:33-965(+)
MTSSSSSSSPPSSGSVTEGDASGAVCNKYNLTPSASIERIMSNSLQAFLIGSMLGFAQLNNAKKAHAAKGNRGKTPSPPLQYEEMATIVAKRGAHFGGVFAVFLSSVELLNQVRQERDWRHYVVGGGISGIFSATFSEFVQRDFVTTQTGNNNTGTGSNGNSNGNTATATSSRNIHTNNSASTKPVVGMDNKNIHASSNSTGDGTATSTSARAASGTSKRTSSSLNTTTVSSKVAPLMVRTMLRHTLFFAAFGGYAYFADTMMTPSNNNSSNSNSNITSIGREGRGSSYNNDSGVVEWLRDTFFPDSNSK